MGKNIRKKTTIEQLATHVFPQSSFSGGLQNSSLLTEDIVMY